MDKLLKKLHNTFKENFDESRQRLVAIDMDGVLTNFEKAFDEATKNSNIDVPPANGMGPHEYEEAHGKDTFWRAVEASGEDFWSNMEWMPDGKELWSYVSKLNPTILSAPSRDPKCITGKVKWLKNNVKLPNYDVQLKSKNGWDGDSKIILNSNKGKFVSSPNDILIDDTLKKIKMWQEAGGIGILHKSASDTIRQLKELGL